MIKECTKQMIILLRLCLTLDLVDYYKYQLK